MEGGGGCLDGRDRLKKKKGSIMCPPVKLEKKKFTLGQERRREKKRGETVEEERIKNHQLGKERKFDSRRRGGKKEKISEKLQKGLGVSPTMRPGRKKGGNHTINQNQIKRGANGGGALLQHFGSKVDKKTSRKRVEDANNGTSSRKKKNDKDKNEVCPAGPRRNKG